MNCKKEIDGIPEYLRCLQDEFQKLKAKAIQEKNADLIREIELVEKNYEYYMRKAEFGRAGKILQDYLDERASVCDVYKR